MYSTREMNQEQQRVKEWMRKFGQEIPEGVSIPSLEVRKLRANLILEEALETISGLGFEVGIEEDPDPLPSYFRSLDMTDLQLKEPPESVGANLEYVADGIADSLVVQLGTAVACGIDIKPVFDEVMRSNDSKLWTEREVLGQIGEPDLRIHNCCICDKPAEFCVCIREPRRFLVQNRDGKVIKSPSYSPAKIQF